MKDFLQNKNYLLNYSIKIALFFTVINMYLLYEGRFTTNFSLSQFDLIYFLMGLLLCGLPSSILHNCAHRNIGPRWLNDAIGEFCGTIMLYGFKGFQLGHFFHHRYPDIKGFDPHPPAGMAFIPFLKAPIKETIEVIENAYFRNFGEDKSSYRNIQLQKVLFNFGILMKVLFWYLALGPKLFLIFYMPMYVSNIFVFAHINYATHRETKDGKIEIVNLNHNLYYQIINYISFGGYFHKNHHLRPKMINPMRVKI